jgi:hypothetical protein
MGRRIVDNKKNSFHSNKYRYILLKKNPFSVLNKQIHIETELFIFRAQSELFVPCQFPKRKICSKQQCCPLCTLSRKPD